MHAYKPAWGTDDRPGHGTPIAGLALFGDLTVPMASGRAISIGHRLELVKVINPDDPHEKELYGAVTQESAFRN